MGLEPRKHHYVPEFYLKQWADENGKLWRYDRPHHAIMRKQVYASQVGFVRDLYTIPGLPLSLSQKIESVWFNRIDHSGSNALIKLLETPDRGWNDENRSAWSRFVISIAHRTPDNLDAFKQSMRMIWEEQVPAIQAKYEEIRKESDPPRFEDYARSRDPLVVEKAAIHAIQGAINNPRIGHFINNMYWKVFDLADSKHSLLISDALLVMSNGLEKPDGHIAIPLSPTKLFIATYEKQFLSEFQALSSQQLTRKMNQLVVGRAKKFVVAHNRNQESFIERRFGTEDAPTLMSMLLSQIQTDRIKQQEFRGH